jgi:hypothetical protein
MFKLFKVAFKEVINGFNIYLRKLFIFIALNINNEKNV